MRPHTNELFISQKTMQRAQSDDYLLVRVCALRLKIERKKANDHWPVGNAVDVSPSSKEEYSLFNIIMTLPAHM